MKTKADILKQKDFHSDRISIQVRAVSLGLMIIVWGFLIGTSNPAFNISTDLRSNLITVGLFALITMCCDFLQYLLGYLNNKMLFHKMEKENKEQIEYDYKDWRYRCQHLFFNMKIILLFISVFSFFLAMLPYLYK